MKPRTYAKVKHVHDTANDEKAPAPVRETAQRQMAALDAGRTTPHVADKIVRLAKERAEADPEQQKAEEIGAFLNRNGALDRGALRVSYLEGKMRANKHLLSLDPARLPDVLDSKDLDGAHEFARRLVAWAVAFEEALPSGLRLLRAE